MSLNSPDALDASLTELRRSLPPAGLVEVLRQMLAEAEADQPPRPDTRAKLLIELAHAHRDLGQVQIAIAKAMDATRFAEESGDVTLRASAILVTANIFFTSGLLAESRRRSELVLALDGVRPGVRLQAALNIASTLRSEGRLAEAGEAFDALLGELEEQPASARAAARINAASCYQQLRRLDDAQHALSLARADLALQSSPNLDAWCDTIEAWVALKAGEMERGIALARKALDPSRSGTSVDQRSSAARSLLQLSIDSGDAMVGAQAAQFVRELVGRVESSGAMREAIDLHESLAAWHEHQGDLSGAVHHLRAMRSIEARTRSKAEQMRLEQENIRSELLRAQVEADTLRTSQEELSRASQALVAADFARANLLATLAHDLRNLLMTLMATVEMNNPEDPAETRRSLDRVSETGLRMQAILDRALAPQALPERPRVELGVLARHSAQGFAELAGRRGQRIVVTADEEVLVAAEQNSLGRLVDNLVSNSVKYAPPGSTITLTVESDRRRARLTVDDEGPGFPGVDPSEGMLFGHRLGRETDADSSGQGVGLYAVYQLLAEVGGILSIGNKAEGGAIVRVTLPRG